MNPIRLFILRLQAIVWTAFAMTCIGLAVLVGLASLLLPYAGEFKPEIESWLGQRIGRPVTLDRVEASWTASGPQLVVHGMNIQSPAVADGSLRVEMANVGFDIYGWLRPGRSGMSYFRLISEQMELIRHEDGSWSLSGLDRMSGGGGNPVQALEWVLGQGGIAATADRFLLIDRAADSTLELSNANLIFNNFGDHQRLSGTIESPHGEGQVRLTVESGEATDGRALQFYVHGEDLDLAQWLAGFPLAGAKVVSGLASMEFWGEWRIGGGLDLNGALEAQQLVLAGRDGLGMDDGARMATRYGLDELHSGVSFQLRDARHWSLHLDGLRIARAGREWSDSNVALARYSEGEESWYQVAADFVRIQDIANALPVFEVLPEALRYRVFQHAPSGDLRNIVLQHLDPGERFAATGSMQVEELGWAPANSIPGVANFAGRLSLDGHDGQFQLDAQHAHLSMPGILRWPLPLDTLDGEVNWGRQDDQWHLDAPGLAFSNTGLDARARAHMILGDGRPFVDIKLDVGRGRIEEARRYWPINRFKPKLLDWLDKALVGGDVTGGSLIIYGDLDDWPFRQHEGRFLARAEVEQATLDYHPEWPLFEDVNAHLQFTADGLSMRSSGATTGGLRVNLIEAELPDYRTPRLALKAEGPADGNALLAYLRETPIQDSHGEYLEGLSIDGNTNSWVNLEFPLKPGAGQRKVVGHVWLEDNHVRDNKWEVDFVDTNGRLDFTDAGIEARDLETRFRGNPANLSLGTGEFVDDPTLAAEGLMVGMAPASSILEGFPLLTPVLDRITGACVWEARLTVDKAGELDIQTGLSLRSPRLVLESRLETARLSLPAPFEKDEGLALPIRVGVDLPDLASDLQLSVGELADLSVHQDPDSGAWSGVVHFGPGDAPEPPSEGLVVNGHIDELDLDAWRDVVAEVLDRQVPQEEQHWIAGIDMTIARLRFAAREFTNLSIRADRDPEYWNLVIVADQMDGRLRLPLDISGNRLMLAEFERLVWQDTIETMPDSGLKPFEIPPLRFYARDLTFMDIPLGTVSFESYPTADGMHIDQLETRSDVLSISANGDWVETDGEKSSAFAATITGEDFGAILSVLDFDGVIEGGQTVVKMDVEWSGSLADFQLAALSGDLDINIGRGEIVEVEPGAGRIFGLLSLTQVPRRLRLDFADLFKSGMVFDTIAGQFQLEVGNAFTDNVLIKSPTAEIKIRGRTGLAERDYNQVITVVPKVGGALPLVGALAGGGAGVAAALVVQGLFSAQLDRITQYHYSVTGNWEDPTVELLGADGGQISMDLPESLPEG